MTDQPTARRHLLDFDPAALGEFFAALGEKPFRAKQVLEWVYRHGAASFDEMTNLSKTLRETLRAHLDVFSSHVVRRLVSGDGTIKLLLQWPDGATSECVMIPDGERRTACISSQVGCPARCCFCASGMNGLQRNLKPGEIVEQVLRVSAEVQEREPGAAPAGDTGILPVEQGETTVPLAIHGCEPAEPARRQVAGETPGSRRGPGGEKESSPGASRLSNIVFMGMGEPLANYDAVIRAVRTINAPWGPNIGARKITISTVGLPKQIRRLADESLQLNLALSLHAPTDGLRQELIPWAEKISLAELTTACRYYFEKTGREITLEYVLLHEVNDRRTHAEQLARFARQLRCNINLIRYNPVAGLPYQRPTSESTAMFQQVLREHGVNAHVRTSRGLDIDAACGQLRRRAAQEAGSSSTV